MKNNIFLILSISIILGVAFCSGCDDEFYRRALAEQERNQPRKKLYRCDEWDAIVTYKDGTTDIVESVESPAKVKNDMIIIYDKRHNFDAKFMAPKSEVRKVEFVKP